MKNWLLISASLIALILVCGCTGTTSTPDTTTAADASGAQGNTPAPTETPAPEPTETQQETTATPTAAATSQPAEPTRTVLTDEGTAVYAGSWKQVSFTDDLGIDYLYAGEQYEIEIKSSQPINVLFVKDPGVPLFKSNAPVWDTNTNRWKYASGTSPVAQYDEVTRKTFVATVPTIGKYSLLLDGRMSPNGVLVVNDAASVDVVITKIS